MVWKLARGRDLWCLAGGILAAFTFLNASADAEAQASSAPLWEWRISNSVDLQELAASRPVKGIEFNNAAGAPGPTNGGALIDVDAWRVTNAFKEFDHQSKLGSKFDRDNHAAQTITAMMVALRPSESRSWSDSALISVTKDIGGTYEIIVTDDNCGPDGECQIYANPIPATIWLFLSALLGLLGIGIRQRRIEGGLEAH